MLLGVIGDDFTGSSDIANVLARGGMWAVQYVGVPRTPAPPAVEVGVVSLKTRSIPASEAVAQSLAALEWLRAQKCRQFVFKYCSTFDSTPEGNIGPVAEALAEALDAWGAIVCPAFPATGRTVYQGHLFVGDRLLSESGMESHPLTPMTDPDLRRWLALQSRSPVGHVPLMAVHSGSATIRERLDSDAQRGCRLVVADAINDDHLVALGQAAAEDLLLTGGSGIALGLPTNFRERGLLSHGGSLWRPQAEGRTAILSGSCSKTTQRQVELAARGAPARAVDPEDVMNDTLDAAELVEWALRAEGTPLIYSTSPPAVVAAAQSKYGSAAVAGKIEALFAETARGLVKGGVTRLIVAGGETSGAVVEGLGLSELEIGPEIDPGVPALRAGQELTLALKSGNFGADDFFGKAETSLRGGS